MADQAQRLKIIADNIELLYQNMRRAAAAIAGLLQIGKATCDEVKAYNLWALACYNTQKGMLATLRANGEKGVPELPTAPTLFAWKGVSDAWNINCASQASTLKGAMDLALRGPTATTQFLSTDQVQVITQDQHLLNPEQSPSFKALLQLQQERGLGAISWAVVVLISAIAVSVSVGLAAIMAYLETSEVQESHSKQVALQAEAFANYTKARLDCYSSCTAQGRSSDECVSICAKIVDKPDIKLPGQLGKWGWLQWTGFTVVAGVGAMVAYRILQRKIQGRPVFELPPAP